MRNAAAYKEGDYVQGLGLVVLFVTAKQVTGIHLVGYRGQFRRFAVGND